MTNTAFTTVVESSANSKLTDDAKRKPISASYVTTESCSRDCPFYKNGCYGGLGYCGIVVSRLDRAAAARSGLTPKRIAQGEASAIEKRWPCDGRPIRLHVVGDCRTAAAARVVSDMVTWKQRRGAGVAFTYTHAWEDVPRNAWGTVSVLASCETAGEVVRAFDRGYAAALVVDRFPDWSGGAFGIACPAQDGQRTAGCVGCRLCMRDSLLLKQRRPILLAAHGSGARLVREAIAAKNNR